MTTRHRSKKKSDKKKLDFDSSSDDGKPPPKRPTRQASYRTFNGTREQERVMVLTALRSELTSKTPSRFIKTNLQPHQKNKMLRTIQDDDIDFEKISTQASRAFSITWVRQIAPGQLQYKPQLLAQYAINQTTQTSAATTKPSPLTGRKTKPTIKSDSSDDESDSQNLLESPDEKEIDQTPTTSNIATADQDQTKPAPHTPPPMTQPSTESPAYRNLQASNSVQESKTSTFDQDDTSSYSYASITRELEQANQILDDTTTDTWKQDLETKLQSQIKTSIATAKDDIMETISTTKGELLTQLDTLRADMTTHEHQLEQRTKQSEALYLKLQSQHNDMEKLSENMHQQQTSLQDFFNTFQKHVTAERQETTTIRDENRKGFKWDIDQASRQYLVQHEKKSEVIMHNARTKQTEEYRQACREIQKEYKRKISQKYDDLETDSMQFADQAILDLGELLNQEKTNILTEVAQDLPNTILTTIKKELTAQLDTTVATHTEALKEQRKQITTQIQKIAKRHREQMIAREDTEEDQLTETINTIKGKASIAFSLELQAQVDQKLLEFGNLAQPKPALATPPAPGYKSHVPLTSNYWAETLHSPSAPARPSPDTPAPAIDRFKFACSKELEAKLPNFRKDQMYIHLPNEPLPHYMEAFYETLATMMNNFDFPIVLLQDLAPRGSTCPTEAYETYERDTIMKISRALYQKLLGVIPHTCTIMHNLLANHAATQDGYKALYAMMRLKCTYLQDLLPTWGPTWQTGLTAFEYVSSINSYITQERRRSKYYTEFEVAAEMIQQAKRHPEYQLLAGAYMAQIIAMPTDQTEMAPEFHTDNLALNFESNKQALNLPANPKLNKFGQPRNDGNDRDHSRERRRPQYKNPVQCTSCKLFGHCIETQVCRFSAQLMYAKAYIEAHADRAKTNAEAYNAANNKNKVNKIYQQFPEKFDEYMTDEERENTRYELATTFYCKSIDTEDA
jgi:hypothetical protein